MRRTAFLAAVVLALAGCAAPPAGPDAAEGGDAAGQLSQAPAEAQRATEPGTTRGQLRARLGNAAVARFASGYEVWVYRFPATRQERPEGAIADRGTEMTELVVLFSPTGVIAKSRLRPAGGAE